MEWLLFFLLAVTLVIIVTAHVLGEQSSDQSTEPVLPSHYDPQNYLPDESKIPGWCRHCETMNEAEYRFCQNCSAELPDVSDTNAEHRRYWFSREG